MYWILAIMAAIAASLIALVVGGLVTPAEYRAVRRMRLQRSAHEVRTVLADLAAYEQWAPWPATIAPSAASTPDAIALHVTNDDTKAQLRWEWRIDADAEARADGSIVTLAETGRVGNPVIRFFAALRGNGGNAERTLRALAEHVGEVGGEVERVEE